MGADDRDRPSLADGRVRRAGARAARRASATPVAAAVRRRRPRRRWSGAHQLANVRWSVLFDDVELTAADIARLAAEARPLVQSGGRWVELDRADLDGRGRGAGRAGRRPPS